MNNNVKTKQNAGISVKTKKMIFVYGFLAWPDIAFPCVLVRHEYRHVCRLVFRI